ncbi:hypothetical protein RDWZM_005571 [Blomia tropicalis]|uniref:Uncharacterized protein n=1 Tax=Blomia tropicalis TaxID=40697 RepID=A0A9Q0RMG5_BLOTA|nr:hypothetical protein RDWZM_005571 [Blomia tropicalis]
MANAVHVYDDDEDTISTIIINRDHGHYRSRQLLTAHQPPTGYLTDHQCANIASLLVNSTEQSMLFTKSCQTNFIYINRLYDQSTLIFVNFPEWSFDNGKRMVIQTSFVRLLFQSMINLVGIRLVVRVEQCNKLVDVSLSPPPPQKSGGLIQMEVNEMENLNIREHLLHEYILSDICEIRLIDNNNNCSLTNSYLVACTKNDDTICQVRVYDWKQKLLECECGTSSNSPLQQLSGVKVGHTKGVPNTGVFLFDILVHLISEPNHQENMVDDPPKSMKSESKVMQRQRMLIFAYILDHPTVYTRLNRNSVVEMPPFPYPNANEIFIKIMICVIIGWMIIEKISQPLTKALYIESIVINVIIVTLSIIQLLRITLANCKILFQSQMEEEERLLIQCGQRAQLYSDSFSEASSSASNKQTDQSSSFTSSSNTSNLSNQSANTATTNKLCDSSFDMPI